MLKSMIFTDYLVLLSFLPFFCSSRLLTERSDVFCRASTNSLKGISMLAIIFLHISMWLEISSYTIVPVGYLGTGVFFFISGYGNLDSVNRRAKDPRWLLDKFRKLYIPFLVAYLFLCAGVSVFVPWFVPKGSAFFINLVTMTLCEELTWFPKIILLCFVLQWLAACFTSSRSKQVAAVTMSLLFFTLLFRFLQFEPFWYTSMLCYALGNLISNSSSAIVKFLWKSRYLRLLVFSILLLLFGFLFVWTVRSARIRPQLVSALLFSLLCYSYTSVFKVSSRLFIWIGKASFEFYVFHICFLQIFDHFRFGYPHWIYTVCVLFGTVFAVSLYSYTRNAIITRFKKQ